MTEPHNLVALVTLLALVLFLWVTTRVGGARRKYNVPAPATTGSPDFERAFRIQGNTLEGLMLFLPSLWLFSIYWNDRLAAGIGAVWLIGRVLYVLGYSAAAEKRALGFAIQGVAAIILLLGALAGVIRAIMAIGLI